MAVHADVGVCGRVAECVGIQFAADVDAGFFGDAVNHAGVFDIFGKYGFDAFAFDLPDDGGDLFGGRLGFAAHALRGDEADVVAVAHVGKCVVPGQDFAFGGRDGIKCGLCVAVQFFKLHLVVAQALLIINFAFGIGLYQGFSDVLGIVGHKNRVVPDVGVIFAVVVVVSFVVMIVVVMVSAFFFGFEGLDAFGRFGIGYFALFDGALDVGGFKSQAVEQDEFCTADF